ncbi:mycothiol system anti-sigma-R factor [Streptomyces sp. 7N604]|uniref:mycothiol system anti-sigma-R factor n=1 Tax=Streptomyces sp. 7N604 TaxID=3457415 RepID=UPI003FCFEF3C
MSCGDPHETDCSEVLDHLYEFLDREMPAGEADKFKEHFDECSPCLEKYGLEQAVKKLVKRCCGHDDVPTDLRSKVMGRIELIRSGEAVPEQTVMEQAVADQQARQAQDADASARATRTAESA